MSTPMTILARERAKIFRHSFSETSHALFANESNKKLYHPGEYGSYRERLLKHLLAAFLPVYLGLSERFVIDGNGQRSTQADIVIFDRLEIPKIETDDLRRFFRLRRYVVLGR